MNSWILLNHKRIFRATKKTTKNKEFKKIDKGTEGNQIAPSRKTNGIL